MAGGRMFYIGIDIGGTFTDCVLIGADEAGHVTTYRTAKALSTKGDPVEGVMTGLAELAGAVDEAGAGRAATDEAGAGRAGAVDEAGAGRGDADEADACEGAGLE